MTLPSTSITLRQAGIVRIEIAAIVMLLVALATVLVTYAPASPSLEIVQVVEPARRPTSVHPDPLILVNSQTQLQTVSVTEPGKP